MVWQDPLMVHRAAETGFGEEADRYKTARPSYHPLLVERFINTFGNGRVIEIGAGTGIFTKQLAAHGVNVVAVEPVEAMRQVLTSDLPGADVRSGTAEDLPVAQESFDVVVVAQSFHWFDYERALDEIHRVLCPGGHLVTVWNVKAGDASWHLSYMEIVDRYADDTPRHADMKWRRAIDDDSRFELVDDWQIDNSQPTDEDGIVSRALSTSFIAALPSDRKSGVADEIRAAIQGARAPLLFPYRGELQAWIKTG